ncbi:hypothetical protein E2562_010982 [Oryza meyeriana var. granulata]|uniref:Uncharacterized protein n=1 Tax=Oryza meyeriana var. granulata TaxID=110450 RepID=A0A6G1BUZ2_9ORYZ|nr:hypothetical protein E2562_010982 [Oryza meyeriana var. granulata]
MPVPGSHNGRPRPAKAETMHGLAHAGDLAGVQRKLQENPALINDRNPVLLGAKAVGDGEQDAAHLGAAAGAAVIGVELLEDGVIERCHLGEKQRASTGSAEPNPAPSRRRKDSTELGTGQHAIVVGGKGGCLLVVTIDSVGGESGRR